MHTHAHTNCAHSTPDRSTLSRASVSTPAEAEREQDEGEEGGSSETELKQKARSF